MPQSPSITVFSNMGMLARVANGEWLSEKHSQKSYSIWRHNDDDEPVSIFKSLVRNFRRWLDTFLPASSRAEARPFRPVRATVCWGSSQQWTVLMNSLISLPWLALFGSRPNRLSRLSVRQPTSIASRFHCNHRFCIHSVFGIIDNRLLACSLTRLFGHVGSVFVTNHSGLEDFRNAISMGMVSEWWLWLGAFT